MQRASEQTIGTTRRTKTSIKRIMLQEFAQKFASNTVLLKVKFRFFLTRRTYTIQCTVLSTCMDAIYFQTSIPQIQPLAQTFQLNQRTFTFCISSSSGNTILFQTFKLLYETCEQPFASSAVNKTTPTPRLNAYYSILISYKRKRNYDFV